MCRHLPSFRQVHFRLKSYIIIVIIIFIFLVTITDFSFIFLPQCRTSFMATLYHALSHHPERSNNKPFAGQIELTHVTTIRAVAHQCQLTRRSLCTLDLALAFKQNIVLCSWQKLKEEPWIGFDICNVLLHYLIYLLYKKFMLLWN